MDGDNGTVTQRETELAVDGQGLYFYFDRKRKVPVLNEANISVPRGATYSLLGPSGCGKTTLLKCIIGQHKLQEGSLKVYGRTPGSKGFPIPGRGVGYMPQDLGLYFEMTIGEILRYFGSLYGMNKQLILERMDFLVELLALPEKKKMIKHLSGGQQRRVSFAIALLHKPPLLILDEPTVGVDPLLRQTIWNHLVNLARYEHSTILITTHYTEEARQADAVGLMRNGHLIVERNPEDLLKLHGVITLEEVFLKLCQSISNEDMGKEKASAENIYPKCVKKNGTNKKQKEEKRQLEEKQLRKNGQDFTLIAMDPLKCDGAFYEKNGGQDNTTELLLSSPLPKEFDDASFSSLLLASFLRFLCLTRKNILRLKRNIFIMIFCIFVPTFQVVIFCMCLGSDPFDLTVAVVNMDEDVNRYGEVFLNSVNNRTVHQERFDNLTAALETVKRGESWAALYLEPEFSECSVDRVLEGAHSTNDTVFCSMVKLYLDRSNNIIATRIYLDLLDGYLKFAGHLLQKYEKTTLLAEPPVKINDYVYGAESTTVLEFMAPAVIVAIVYIIAIGVTAIVFLEEKKLGLFERSFVAGATHVEVLLSLFFVLLVIIFLQVIVMLICAFLVFNIPCNGPVFWVVIGVLFVGLGGLTYGFLVSTLTDDFTTAAVITVGTFFPTLLLNGVIWPVEAMPYYLRYFSYCLPLTKMIDSVRSIVARGWSLEDYNVWNGFLICNFWTILFMILSVILFKHKK